MAFKIQRCTSWLHWGLLLPLGSLPLFALLIWTVSGCAANPAGNARVGGSVRVQSLDLNNLVTPTATDAPVSLSAAKNEWANFQLQVSGLPAVHEKVAYTLRLQPLNLKSANRSISNQVFSAYQILSMPVDVNRAGYVRHTGLTGATRSLPRALLPMAVDNGRVNLSAARDPNHPTDPQGRAGASPIMLWVDLHIPPETPAGNYSGVCEVIQSGVDQPIASVPLNLNVYDFVLPDKRHLDLVGQLDWDSFTRLYPNRFEAVTPRLINRTDPRYAEAVKTFDQLVTTAQAHRVEVVIPRLSPTAKWPGGSRLPLVTWDDFDSLVSPWLKGEMFADKEPLGYWPLPECEGLSVYDPISQRQYWANAAAHFDQLDWLSRCPVFIEKGTPNRATSIEALKLSGDAASVLSAHSRVRVTVPLEDDQIQFATENTPNLIRNDDASRLVTANPGIVFSSPIQTWPSGVTRPPRWMRTDLTGLIPYIGAGGDERDVRLWAWLSFLPLPPPQLGLPGPVQTIRWVGGLPKTNNPSEPADPNDLIWFYPGSWFGIDQPLPTIQLKWLRRAQQDFEYLYLARQRGDIINTLVISRLMTKPVQLDPNQEPDPTYGLMSGTADPKAWEQALDFLAKGILLNEPGQKPDTELTQRLSNEIVSWSRLHERPLILGRSTYWAWEARNNQAWINLGLGIDIYNPSDSRPDHNQLNWGSVPSQSGWQILPQPIQIDALATYHVGRYSIGARVDPTQLRKVERRAVQINFTNGYDNRVTSLPLVVPIGISDRREALLMMDGQLNDWSPDDAIQDGPMIQMFNRPALQAGILQVGSKPAQVFTGWGDEKLYVAFKLTGLSQSPVRTVRNDIFSSFRRAWDEDVCQILIQPIYADNSRGPVLHVVCKPSGATWVERKLDPRAYVDPWQAMEGAGLRYVATINGQDWRGEIGIPWKAINEPDKKSPVMLRFNFTQHTHETGESASWAGPIDFGRDDAFTGVLLLREPERLGMRP